MGNGTFIDAQLKLVSLQEWFFNKSKDKVNNLYMRALVFQGHTIVVWISGGMRKHQDISNSTVKVFYVLKLSHINIVKSNHHIV